MQVIALYTAVAHAMVLIKWEWVQVRWVLSKKSECKWCGSKYMSWIDEGYKTGRYLTIKLNDGPIAEWCSARRIKYFAKKAPDEHLYEFFSGRLSLGIHTVWAKL